MLVPCLAKITKNNIRSTYFGSIAENDFFGFPEVKTPQLTGYIGGQIYMLVISNFLRILCSINHKNQLIFDRVIWTIKSWQIFGTQCIFYLPAELLAVFHAHAHYAVLEANAKVSGRGQMLHHHPTNLKFINQYGCRFDYIIMLVSWHSGRTSVFGRQTFPVPCARPVADGWPLTWVDRPL